VRRDPGGEVHRPTVDVAVTIDHPTRFDARVGRRQLARADGLDQLDDSRQTARDVRQSQHRAVTQEFHHPAAVSSSNVVGQLLESSRRADRQLVARTVGHRGVSGQVHECDDDGGRRRRLATLALGDRRLEGVDVHGADAVLEVALLEPDQQVGCKRAEPGGRLTDVLEFFGRPHTRATERLHDRFAP
jgi:hypothetical protein